MKFVCEVEKLCDARRYLMIPHPQGEAESIALAFLACEQAFRTLNEESMDMNARRCAAKIREMMNTADLPEEAGYDSWIMKARRMNFEQKKELSKAVDDLANWFEFKYWDSVTNEKSLVV